MPLVTTNESYTPRRLKDLKPGALLRVNRDGDIYMHTGRDIGQTKAETICIVHLRSGVRYYNPDTMQVFPLAASIEVTITQE